ncbi:MAG: T9SS type A sorting domain-containing protein [Chitinophagaceae bacterium]|nr:MAG: T9SS type A sorting domain-containing protein [Chitinophagaceae bacterium]
MRPLARKAIPTPTSTAIRPARPSAPTWRQKKASSWSTPRVVQYPGGTIAGGNGTSFATPNLAGLITCLWQGFPELNNMTVIDALRQSGTKATAPDSIVGYGIPDVRKALIALTKMQVTSASTQSTCKATISWSSKDVSGMRYELQRNVPGQAGYTTVFSTAGTGPVFGALHNYQFADTLTGVSAGAVNYRVVQYFDTTAASPASDIIATQAINLSAACAGTGINAPGYSDRSIVLQPNPARNTVTVQLTLPSSESDVLIVVTDAIGKQVHQQKWSAAAGSTLVPVSVSKFASGKYFVSVYAGGRLIGTRELVKL